MTNILKTYISPSAKQFPVKIVYEDNHLLAAIKPAGLLSQEDRTGGPDILTILKEYLVRQYNKPGKAWLGLLHRLDQPVSGLMIFAKSSKAASRMSALFRDEDIEKGYQAIVHGILPEKEGVWLDKISAQKKLGRYYIDPLKGKESSLYYKVEKEDKSANISLLSIHLFSGRSHQIRVQCSSRKHPLVGDLRYGKGSSYLDKQTEGPALFANRLSFLHPVRKEKITICACLPQEGIWSLFS